MATKLVFDIETVGLPFDALDEASREYLLKFAKTPEEQQEVRESTGFYPHTGQVVAIGILNPDTDKGAVYYQAPDSRAKTEEDGNAQYVPFSTEKALLKEFWEIAKFYDQFITFNGRGFDAPYLAVRSAINKVKPSKNLMPNRYYDNHIDLMDRLSFYGAVRRKMPLHMWCRAFGIKSPKESGTTGNDVNRLFNEKKYLDIAKYCYGDIEATRSLYEYWDKYINIK